MQAKIKLMASASIKFFIGLVLVAMLLFLPAGTIHYNCGWLFLAVLFLPVFIAGVVMLLRSPELLRKRLDAKEKETEQKSVVALSGVMFIAAFIVAGLNFRYSWTVMPSWVIKGCRYRAL